VTFDIGFLATIMATFRKFRRYEVHGKILATDVPYDNRFVSIATIENRKILLWRDYMDSLAAWRALNGAT